MLIRVMILIVVFVLIVNQLLGRPVLESLLFDDAKRRAMASASRRLGKPNAAEQVAASLVHYLSSDP